VRTVVPGPCPYCNTEIEYIYQTENIPYFSDILIISANCSSCGYKYVDTQLLTDKEPVRYEVVINSGEDLSIRIVRSMSASIEIPELGVRIDPGPACQGFVSNVEGVLDRIEQILNGALLWGEGNEQENARNLLARIGVATARSFQIKHWSGHIHRNQINNGLCNFDIPKPHARFFYNFSYNLCTVDSFHYACNAVFRDNERISHTHVERTVHLKGRDIPCFLDP
jgi:zinc finger protein